MASPFGESFGISDMGRCDSSKERHEAPSVEWSPLSGTRSTDALWSKAYEMSAMDAMDALDINDVLDAGVSSGSSTYSDGDLFPGAAVHHLPAWSTFDSVRRTNAKHASASAIAAGSVSQGASPADAISPSGLSDHDNGRVGGGNTVVDDIWFTLGPESLSMDNAHRKKRNPFPHQLPSRFGGSRNMTPYGSDDPQTSPKSFVKTNNLKSHKSMPQLARRVSSGYSARVEDLLVEMGWSRQQQQGTEDEEATDADLTIDGNRTVQEGNSNFEHSTSQTDTLHDMGSYEQYPSSSHSVTSSVSGSLASGMQMTTSALFKRRAVSREGAMPSPSPVTIPRRSDEKSLSEFSASTLHDGLLSVPKTSSDAIKDPHAPVYLSHLQQSSIPKTASAVMTTFSDNAEPQSAMANNMTVDDKQLHPYSQPMSKSNLKHPSSRRRTTLQGGQQTFLYNIDGAQIPGKSNQKATSSLQPSPAGAARLGPSPISGRPGTASSGSNGTELHTPITPFTGLNLGSTDGSNSGHLALPYMSQMPSGVPMDYGALMSKFDKDIAQNDAYLSCLQNALGLYQPSQTMMEGVNPAAVLGPDAYSSRSLNDSQAKENMTTKGNRARAGTAMAALGFAGPRVMRSSPNLRIPPSPEGAHPLQDTASSTTSTPAKRLRKIASNRRLKHTPDSSSNTSIAVSNLPSSPISPSKRSRTDIPASSSATASNGGFEFINYGMEDAEQLCAAVAPSGSYKIPLKGFGDDHDDDESINEYEAFSASPRRARRRSKSNSNRNGAFPDDRSVPPLPTRKGSLKDETKAVDQIGDSSNEISRHIKRQKSEANLTLDSRRKSASMANLRR